MSVPTGKRNTSEIEFLWTAKNIDTEMCRAAKKFPKSMMFLKSQRMAQLAMDAYYYALSANSTYPLNQHEAQLRRDLFIKASNTYKFLIAQIEVIHDIAGVSPERMQRISALIYKELNLISAVMKRDRERYKRLPQ